MKTSIKQLAAGTFIALLLTVGNVYANGTEAKVSSHENIETTLQLENWMTDETIWNAVSIVDFTLEKEANMEIENWMTNETIWNSNNNFIEETEADMELESWMTDEQRWNNKDIAVETKLSLENWMIDSEVWN